MSRYATLVLTVFALISMVTLGCRPKNDSDPSPTGPSEAEIKAGQLNGVWQLQTTGESGPVSFNGEDITSTWQGFQLTISNSTTQGGSFTSNSQAVSNDDETHLLVWPLAGTMSYDPDVEVLTRSDGVTMTAAISSDSSFLSLSFDYAQPSSARVNNVDGNWSFRFDRAQ